MIHFNRLWNIFLHISTIQSNNLQLMWFIYSQKENLQIQIINLVCLTWGTVQVMFSINFFVTPYMVEERCINAEWGRPYFPFNVKGTVLMKINFHMLLLSTHLSSNGGTLLRCATTSTWLHFFKDILVVIMHTF